MTNNVSNSLISEMWNHPLDPLVPTATKPARWCMRNIKMLAETTASSPAKIAAEKVAKFFLTLFSALALIFVLPMALIGDSLSSKPTDKNLLQVKAQKDEREYVSENGLEIDHQRSALADLQSMNNDQLDNDWNILKKFGHIRVINLDRSPERFVGAVNNLKEIGLPANQIHRFSAILGDTLPSTKTSRMDNNHKNYPKDSPEFVKLQKRQTGCYMSHYTIVKEAKEAHDKAKSNLSAIEAEIVTLKNLLLTASANDQPKIQTEIDDKMRLKELAKAQIRKFSSVVIIEDDNRMGRLTGNFSYTLKRTGQVFRKVMMDLPKDYDIFFLTTYECNGEEAGGKKWIRKVNDCYDLNCYAVHSRFYEKYLDQLKKIEDDSLGKIIAVDRELPKCFPQNKAFISTPPLAMQGGCVSTITQGGQVDHFEQRHRARWETVNERLS